MVYNTKYFVGIIIPLIMDASVHLSVFLYLLRSSPPPPRVTQQQEEGRKEGRPNNTYTSSRFINAIIAYDMYNSRTTAVVVLFTVQKYQVMYHIYTVPQNLLVVKTGYISARISLQEQF